MGFPGTSSRRVGDAVRVSSTTPGLADVFCRTGGEDQVSAGGASVLGAGAAVKTSKAPSVQEDDDGERRQGEPAAAGRSMQGRHQGGAIIRGLLGHATVRALAANAHGGAEAVIAGSAHTFASPRCLLRRTPPFPMAPVENRPVPLSLRSDSSRSPQRWWCTRNCPLRCPSLGGQTCFLDVSSMSAATSLSAAPSSRSSGSSMKPASRRRAFRSFRAGRPPKAVTS